MTPEWVEDEMFARENNIMAIVQVVMKHWGVWVRSNGFGGKSSIVTLMKTTLDWWL